MLKKSTKPGFRLAAAIVALIAVASLTVDTIEALYRIPDRTVAEELWRRVRYFTILTNVLAAVSFGVIALTGRVRADFAAALTLWMAIVGIVYHALLGQDLNGLRLWTDHGMHTIGPIAVSLWWLVYAPKSGLRPVLSAYWVAYPAGYAAYALIRGALDGEYPYFFVNPIETGWPMVGVWILALAVSFWIGGLIIIGLAGLLSRGTRSRSA